MRGLTLLLTLALVACGGDSEHGEDHSHVGHEGHNHAPKYGGRLVELGDHEFQVELLLYSNEGKLEAYMWDGHVEVPIPCAMTSIKIEGEADAKSFTIELQQAPPLYGKPIKGKSTKFSGQHDALKGALGFKGKLVEVTLADKTFSAVAFEYTEDAHDHDHEGHDHG